MRPGTLADIARATLRGDSFDRFLAEFLDAFYPASSEDCLREKPLSFADRSALGAVEDAYLAATAEELARTYRLPVPDWVVGPKRQLRCPWFASPLASLRAVLLHESPPSFRARNLFISENGLGRV